MWINENIFSPIREYSNKCKIIPIALFNQVLYVNVTKIEISMYKNVCCIFLGISITQTSYQIIYSKSKPIYFNTNVSTIFLGINFIRLAAHFVLFFQSLQYTVCNMQIFYFMNSANFLSSTLLFTPQRHSCSLVLQKPQPFAQNLSGPHPRHLSFVYGILVHRTGDLFEHTQPYCSECTPVHSRV